ncbi:MAG: hypothetical protein ACERKN_09920 [Velocimicrobium sp.]
MKYKNRIIVGSLLLAMAIPTIAHAGNINGNEQSVLGIVQGGFEYDGVYYTAAPGYVDKVRSYLAQDDIDLTAEQASEAASEIYANIQTGITEGYIIPNETVDKTSIDEPDPLEEKPTDGSKSKDKKESKEPTEVQPEEQKQVVISASSGMVEAIDSDGNQLFVSESVIKDTGYNLSGGMIVLVFLIIGIGLCMMLTMKYQLLAYKDES